MEIRTDIKKSDSFDIEEELNNVFAMWKERFDDLYELYDMGDIMESEEACKALLALENLKDNLDDYMAQEAKLYAHSKIDIDYGTYEGPNGIELGPCIVGFHIYPPEKEYRMQLENRHYLSGE